VSVSVEPLGLAGVQLVSPVVHGDQRGFFLERFRASEYAQHGIGPFVQDNHSRSVRGVLRGLHWQLPPMAQGKLVSVLQGSILDVAVDLRHDADSFGRWVSAVLDDVSFRQLWLPPGFAHGFVVLSERADVLYKTTAEYAPELERGFAWHDPDVAIAWGEDAPQVSKRDAMLPRLRDLTESDLFTKASAS